MSKKNHPNNVSAAGKTLSSPKSSQKAKSGAGKTLAKHKSKSH